MRLGFDIGSTTIKCVVLNDENVIEYFCYERHYSHIIEKISELLERIKSRFGADTEMKMAISGSAGMGFAQNCDLPFVQEVFATRVAANSLVPDVDVIIELGGEDAKILFFDGAMEVRMNGSCAGGTGSFIDQMATLLKLDPSALNDEAAKKENVYTIASRCGVFAKTDVQLLLNQGARIPDIASSIFYSVVNQSIAGLAQGRKIEGKIVYLGGPLTFLSELRSAFDDVLKTQGTLPEMSLYFVSIGAALYADKTFTPSEVISKLGTSTNKSVVKTMPALFETQADYDAFTRRHAQNDVREIALEGFTGSAHLGVDAGSTTVKTVLIDEAGNILHKTYNANRGNPLPFVKAAMMDIYQRNPNINIKSMTTTGYGEALCKTAFDADYGVVETVAHLTSARFFRPDVDFIIDIGGQDMKCFSIENGQIDDIFLNEACSSGCGSFLQTYAESLGLEIEEFAQKALFAPTPVDLGSRCTVFMNSSIKQAQKDGASLDNISAGLAISVVKNAIYKVIRAPSAEALGRNIVVQGGTFHNDAVLRAFEREMGCEVIRPSIAGLMGAFGAALYGRDLSEGREKSDCINLQGLMAFTHTTQSVKCGMCTNNCSLTVNTFSNGKKSISGNKCDRPVTKRSAVSPDNLYDFKMAKLMRYGDTEGTRPTIGIPRVLNIYETLPFWHTMLTQLGFGVKVSPVSTRELYFKGQDTIPSDTVCYPAKLVHGHVRYLAEQSDVDGVFFPCMSYNIEENLGENNYNCPVVAYYPEVIGANCQELESKKYINDYLGIHMPKHFPKKFHQVISKYYSGISLSDVQNAADMAYKEYEKYLAAVRIEAAAIIRRAREAGKPIIVLSGRPYHLDDEVNHGIDSLIISLGAAVITEDSISHLETRNNTEVLDQWTYHSRLYAAAQYTTKQPDFHLVQLVSFGCGLDAVTTDEVRRILHRSGKLYTQIKIDEIANLGAANIRLRCLFAALENDSAKDK